MSEIILQAENVSKSYNLGSIDSGSLRQELQLFWQTKVLKRETDFFKDVNKNNPKKQFWALRDVNFEVKRGETWGIIGGNGAGKSTLLKILSRIIRPTTGVLRGRGRLSSLLEVGTGFHQELTGRENIFINGNMLGMKRWEIQRKFDEIVEFSGVEEFIDTPVKRYSSGMYVRLAFAVAAHLEPDILIVDEVLAVGDVEFQKKCLGKMKEASSEDGRTVIFVSHNLQAIQSLCSKALWLEKGRSVAAGEVKTVINSYLRTQQKNAWKHEYESIALAPGNEHIRVLNVELIPKLSNPLDQIDIRTELTVKFKFYNLNNGIHLTASVLLFGSAGECIFNVPSKAGDFDAGMFEAECTIPGNFLNDGSYFICLYFARNGTEEIYCYNECLIFDVADYREETEFYYKWWGIVRPDFKLILNKVA
ncbi:ABC transporter ATP-binding protein [Desertivirga brevis]|uniref:ABC transporter ATP-binding protein n=1 Tax=Desertivirga brevis TaxID=2810310 RepID=UPI001A97CD0A|nr:ABC transporter ATP-binding protein [Pedobacter sp. SYSU D00873]